MVELIKAFDAGQDDVTAVVPYRRIWNRHATELLPHRRFSLKPTLAAPYPQLMYAAARPRCSAAQADLVHHTFYHPRFLRDYPSLPKVVTIYDMIPEIIGEKGKFGRNPHLAKREYVRRAQRLIFISSSAREDMQNLYGPLPCPSEVIHLGVDQSFSHPGRRPDGFPREYLLFVGRRGGYKDFRTMLHGFRELADDHPQLVLVCVGGGPFNTEELQLMSDLRLASRVQQFSLSDADLPGSYAHAQCFVFPSKYEGFGLPTLEAMSAGTPVVLADTPALVEVGGSAARYFAAGNATELAGQLQQVIVDEAERTRLIDLGKKHAAPFTWSATAQKTARVYRELLS